MPAAVPITDRADFLPQTEPDAVDGGMVRQGIGQLIGAGNGGIRNEQGSYRLRIDLGLQAAQFLLLHKTAPYAIGLCLVHEPAERPDVLLMEGHHHCAVFPVGDAQFPAHLPERGAV